MGRYNYLLVIIVGIFFLMGPYGIKDYKYIDYKNLTKEELIEHVLEATKTTNKEIIVKGTKAWSEIIHSNRFTSDEKMEVVVNEFFYECIYKPYRIRISNSTTEILSENIDNIAERLNKELKSKYAEDECYRNKIIIALGYLGYGGREIGDEIIKIFDNPYGEFRISAVNAFGVGKYYKYYSKEEMMPYIRKLAKDGYMTEGNILPDVLHPKKECWGKFKRYPVRSYLIGMLKYYGIKFRYVLIDECSDYTIELDE